MNHLHVINTTTLSSQQHAIAQVVFPNYIDSLPVILPIVASLTRQASNQWVTWVTHRQPHKAMLEAQNANLNCLRIVHVQAHTDIRWIAWQALAQHNSHTVIAEQREWHQEDIKTLEQAAIETGSKGLMVSLPT